MDAPQTSGETLVTFPRLVAVVLLAVAACCLLSVGTKVVVPQIERLTLTEEERQAIEYAIVSLERMVLRPDADHHADVLRKLLERLK